MEYIDRFPEQLKQQQTQWGPDYLNYLSELLAKEQIPLIKALPHLSPMPYSQLLSLYRLAQKHHQGTEAELIQFIKKIDTIFNKHGGKTNKIVNQLETLSMSLKIEADSHWFIDAIEVLDAWNPADIDSYMLLLNQSQNWFYKNRFAPQYHDDLFSLWHNLAKNKEKIAKLPEFVTWCLSLPGKSWYQILEMALNSPTIDFSAHVPQLNELWQHSIAKKKVLRHGLFEHLISQLGFAYKVINSIVPSTHQAAYKEQLAKLSEHQLETALIFINKQAKMFEKHPKLVQAVLNLVQTDHSMDLQVLEKVIQFLETNDTKPTDSKEERIAALLKILSQFKSNTEHPINPRVVMMYLLNQKLLVNNKDWSDSFNETLLEQSFNYYFLQTKQILQKKWGSDLNSKQQHSLLSLTQELSLIGSDLTISTQSGPLSQQINTLVQSSLSYYFFKPDAKNVEIMNELQKEVSQKLSASNVGYKTVLNSLQKARLETFNYQIEKNKGRWFHRESTSTFNKTIDAIEHEVVLHWMTDDKTMFANYRDHYRSSFYQLTALLINHLKTPERPLLWFLGYKTPNFSGLIDRLNIMTTLESDPKTLNALMDELDAKIDEMPKYVRSLAREVLGQGLQLEKTLSMNQKLPPQLHKPSRGSASSN